MKKHKILDFIDKTVQSSVSMVRMLPAVHHWSQRKSIRQDDFIVVLGNGPSLRNTIDVYGEALKSMKTMAVNFAANTSVFVQLKPDYYILADPHFFANASSDANVRMLWENISAVDWPMTLLVPYGRLNEVQNLLPKKSGITVAGFPMCPCEGFAPLCHAAYNAGIGTPRPRNVLIPALMAAIRLGFGTIYVAGADHSWTKTLDVDENNRVISVQPHFYEDNDHEKRRVVSEYHNYPLHSILKSLYIAFKSYFDIRQYADKIGVKVINVTPGSFIDAFERGDLPSVIVAR